jgi:hypothetical protein
MIRYLKIRTFGYIAHCNLVEIERRFRGAYFNKNARCYIPEGCNLYKHSHENLKSHNVLLVQRYRTPHGAVIDEYDMKSNGGMMINR